MKEDGGITVQKFLSSKTSLEDTSGAALASYSPKLGKKKMKKLKKAEREKNKGKDWFNMPVIKKLTYFTTSSLIILFTQKALELTEERKADLELLQMRGVLDPKRFYKRSDKEGLPKNFQVPSLAYFKICALLNSNSLSDWHSGGQCCRLLHRQGAEQGKEIHHGG